jgi:predicted dehydrogenase
MRSTVRIGVLGMGRWGRSLIATFDREAEVVVACNTGAPEPRAWLERAYPHIRASSDAHEVLDDRSLDALVIATPIGTHADLAIDALAAGHDVFVEKPLAMDEAAARRVVAMAVETGRTLFVGHTFLFDAGLEWLGSEVAPHEITAVRTVWHKYGTFREPLVWNLLPHDLAIVMALCGHVPGSLVVQDARAGQSELDRLELELEIGAVACRIEIDRYRSERLRQVGVEMRDGTRYLWSDGVIDRVRDGRLERVTTPGEEPLAREVRAFIDACSGGRVPHGASGAFAVQVVQAVEHVLVELDVWRARTKPPAPQLGP